MDIFSHSRERYIILYCEDKVIKADLLNSSIFTYQDNNLLNKEKYHSEDINDMYLEQLRYFILNYTKKNHKIMNNIAEASRLLESVLEFKNKTVMEKGLQ